MCYHHLNQYYYCCCRDHGDDQSHCTLPCLHCHPHSYIRMVQHLIERCLLMRMDVEQCAKALAEHAKITPVVTLTVWRELLKENRDFFHAYYHDLNSPSTPTTPFQSRQMVAQQQRHCSPRFTRRGLNYSS